MKAMEIDSSYWTYEMRHNAVKKLEELGYVPDIVAQTYGEVGKLSITSYRDGSYILYDTTGLFHDHYFQPTYEQLMAMTREDVI